MTPRERCQWPCTNLLPDLGQVGLGFLRLLGKKKSELRFTRVLFSACPFQFRVSGLPFFALACVLGGCPLCSESVDAFASWRVGGEGGGFLAHGLSSWWRGLWKCFSVRPTALPLLPQRSLGSRSAPASSPSLTGEAPGGWPPAVCNLRVFSIPSSFSNPAHLSGNKSLLFVQISSVELFE